MVDVAFGSIFLFAGLAACAIAGILRRSGARIFIWLGLWSALYGLSQLTLAPSFTSVLPAWLQSNASDVRSAVTYVAIFPAAVAFRELSLGNLRLLMQGFLLAEAAVGLVAVALAVVTISAATLMLFNQVFRAAMLVVLTVVVAVPVLSRRYLVLPDRGVLAVGMLVFSVEAIVNSLSQVFGYRIPRAVNDVGFAVLLAAFAYVALRLVIANERRLLRVESELSVAREIQNSILPAAVPELRRARISAAYSPMTEVAGDFYEFLSVDANRAGFFIADVCGHGVPAALIASMVKVGVRTFSHCASDPGALLCALNRLLSGLLRGPLISAACLWLDTEQGTAAYAAAGHPPLLRWRDGELERIESNGLLFGVRPEYSSYPVFRFSVSPGDRFLLCTDGMIEPENAAGEPFGDRGLHDVLQTCHASPPAELSEHLLRELRRWPPASRSQQDDVTLIVIDAL